MVNPENAAENTYELASSEHEGDSGVELHAGSGGGSVNISFDVREPYEEVRVLVQNSTGAYSVDLQFDNTSLSLQDSASADLETIQKSFGQSTVDVTISDDSGVSNTIDYDVKLV